MIQNPRRLSLGKAVKSLKKGLPSSSSNFESTWSRLSRCCCEGFIYALNTFKFIGTIYILHQVIPILHTVSKSSQKGFVTSHIAPNIAYAKLKLEEEALSHKAIYDAVQDRNPNEHLTVYE